MKKLLLLPLLPLMIYANPTSGWQDSANDTGGWLFLLGAWALIFIIGGFSMLKDKIFKQTVEEDTNKETDIIDNELDTEEDIAKAKEQMLKGFNTESVEENDIHMTTKEINNDSRDPIYILIILALCMFIHYQYSEYRQDSYSRTQNCFRDVVPADDKEYCDTFIQEYKELSIKADAVEIIEGCFNESIPMCENEDITFDECLGITDAFCTARHPEYMEHYRLLIDNE
tara:strand:- start:77 stop:760 length:684 start_codon:yes stop_codon:yes gene_type:complete